VQVKETSISGCYEILPEMFRDGRGIFVKTFHSNVFASNGLVTSFVEEYYSISKKNVLRGMHFHAPPKEHTKVVYCVYGRVMDAVVDLRVGSSTYGMFETFELSSEKANMVYISPGLAHGFYVNSRVAIMVYKVTTVYSAKHDSGILWSSLGLPWPGENPIVSARDSSFGRLDEFDSPFNLKNP